ncbi:MAG: hypothetical protein J0M11_18155 [Anaerolineae bacterium]|nr:hypothetical protein [Anaerolineae bacterium]
MEFRVHKKLNDNIRSEQRDIALITAPGMGLSTLLNGIADNQNRVAFINIESLQVLWNEDFKHRGYNKKYVIHAATIEALIKNSIIQADIDPKRTNLKKFLIDQNSLIKAERIYIIIDNFDELDDDLEKAILDELKVISDQKENIEEYFVFNSLRFVIGGCVDFNGLYPEGDSGISPATQFCKHYPDDFLLSKIEIDDFLKAKYPEIMRFQFVLPLIYEWTNGYLHYVEYLTKWILEQIKDNPSISFESLVLRFQEVIEENKQIPLLKYCRKAWDQIKTNPEHKQILQNAIKSPFIRELSSSVRILMKYGVLLEKHSRGQKYIYHVPNHIVRMYLRQRFAELKLVLPVGESPIWWVMEYNLKAYSLLFEIENTMRNYIGDVLFDKSNKNRCNWKDYLDIEFDGKNIKKHAEERRQKDNENYVAVSGGTDPILGFLDFADLAYIVKFYKEDFPTEFAEKSPIFLHELNYNRRRIAHNRPMTLELITNLESRWKQMKNMMHKSN